MFFIYWFVQAIWVFNISLPIIFINSSDKPFSDGSLSELDYVCIFGFAFAVAIEILADVNKAIWVKKGRQGGFCTGMYYSLSVCVYLCKKSFTHSLTQSLSTKQKSISMERLTPPKLLWRNASMVVSIWISIRCRLRMVRCTMVDQYFITSSNYEHPTQHWRYRCYECQW